MRCGHHRELHQLLPGPILEIASAPHTEQRQLGHYTRMVTSSPVQLSATIHILYLNTRVVQEGNEMLSRGAGSAGSAGRQALESQIYI